MFVPHSLTMSLTTLLHILSIYAHIIFSKTDLILLAWTSNLFFSFQNSGKFSPRRPMMKWMLTKGFLTHTHETIILVKCTENNDNGLASDDCSAPIPLRIIRFWPIFKSTESGGKLAQNIYKNNNMDKFLMMSRFFVSKSIYVIGYSRKRNERSRVKCRKSCQSCNECFP